ncbi:glycine--tRNA ligase [Thermorudis peleae]|uniref:glycine--tRNA ligase n=1 Tax=Thermorudis peleae TaxID=1382356 RepID=UPI0009DCDAD5|nr:glycine--tRNA ligase [Thermorudis peleae]
MSAPHPVTVSLDTLASLAKRRGFVYPGSEIYGGLANTWDFGPLGAELKRNIKQAWWEFFIQRREDMVGLDGGILLHPRVWEASGHVAEFNDPLIDCRNCKSRFRADTFVEERLGISAEGLSVEELTRLIEEYQPACPVCGQRNWTPVRRFNLMFKTFIGPVEEQSAQVYLRPETAQAIFVNFKQVLQSSRQKIPFGIGQIGKAFRNEITPGNFIFRLLEFEQMEIEYFIRPESWEAAFEHWLAEMGQFFARIGLRAERLRLREHSPHELSHYSKRTVDYEYLFPFGWKELAGLAYRTDYDLRRHQEYSGEDLSYFDQERNERFIPHVIEPTMGVERLFLALLVDAYDEEPAVDVNGKPYTRVVLRFHPRIAPYKAAVLPLMRKPELVEKARAVAALLRNHFMIEYDETQSIGRRYRRQDEIGTPYCITIDYQTLDDDTVTIRDRDTMAQDRVAISALPHVLAERLGYGA